MSNVCKYDILADTEKSEFRFHYSELGGSHWTNDLFVDFTYDLSELASQIKTSFVKKNTQKNVKL